MKKKIALIVLIVALMALAPLRIIRFSVVNDSDYPVSFRMDYRSDDDGYLVPTQSFIYVSDVPPDGKTYTYSVVKTPYDFQWFGGKGVCLKPAIGLTYVKNGLILEPVVSTLLRFKQCYNMPGWYWDWLERWELEDWQNAYIY
jgi:hypothetical protein